MERICMSNIDCMNRAMKNYNPKLKKKKERKKEKIITNACGNSIFKHLFPEDSMLQPSGLYA